MELFKPPPNVSFYTGNAAENWRRWVRQFKTYFTAAELSKKSAKTQVAILLHCAGPEAQDIHANFKFSGVEGDKADNYLDVIAKFTNFVEPRKNECFERYKLWKRNQKDGETIDQWVTDLRHLIKNCEYNCSECECTHVEDGILRDKIVFSIEDARVKDRLLREIPLTLSKVLDICRAAEASKQQMLAMAGSKPETASTEINVVTKKFQGRQVPLVNPAGPRNKCNRCGTTHPPRRCPAFGKQCLKCKGWNHFMRECGNFKNNQRQVNLIDHTDREASFEPGGSEASKDHRGVRMVDLGPGRDLYANTEQQQACPDEEPQYVFVGVIGARQKQKNDTDWYAKLDVNGNSVIFELDTGARANVLPLSMAKQLLPTPVLKKTNVILHGFDKSEVKPLGVTDLKVHGENTEGTFQFFVCDHPAVTQCILGRYACNDLGLVRRVKVCLLDSAEPVTMAHIQQGYKDVFSGLGQFEKEYEIKVKEGVEGVRELPRRVPYALQPRLKNTLDKLKEQNVIADVEQPTEWVSSLVVVEKKDGSLRLCLDPKSLNSAIMREQYVIPTPADVQARLHDKKLFTVVDMKDAYWHVKLSEQSSFLTTFNTPWGRKRFLRMPFGICSASEVMQKKNEETFGDIMNVHVIADDLIIAGADESEHDTALLKVLDRAREKNVRFSLPKLQFKTTSVKYMGNVVSVEGLKPDPQKIEAILNMPPPTDTTGLQRLLGMVRYLTQYIPEESSITAPLRELLKKETEWKWQPEHDEALEKLKTVLTSDPVLTFYDVTKPVVLQVDSSQKGLGACLLQDKKPVAYASRALTEAEQNYAQIEKELLAVVYGCEKFRCYIYGKDNVTVQTDHKPLESILKKPLYKASPRLQRLILRLQPYHFNVVYVPGKFMYAADTLSRAYIQGHADVELEEDLSVMVHSLVASLPVSASSLNDIRSETSADCQMQKLKGYILRGWPKSQKSVVKDIQEYWNIRDELHIAEEVIFVGERAVIPRTLRKTMLSLLHESHQGIERCRSRARMVMYWPGMAADIEQTVAECATCQRYQRQQAREPMIPHEIPKARYQKVGLDIMSFKGKDFLVAVDYYSKFPELVQLADKTAGSVVTSCKSIFARHGIPCEVISDNMPFDSVEFRKFANEWGIEVTTSSPGYAQSNGQAERTIQTLKNLLKKADEEGRDPYIALLEHRNTPISGLKHSPAQLLNSRVLRTKLPAVSSVLQPRVVSAHGELKHRQIKQKKYYDQHACKQDLHSLSKGSVVRVRHNKMWHPAVVVNRARHGQPRSYLVQGEYGQLRRNRRHLRVSREQPPITWPASVANDCVSDTAQSSTSTTGTTAREQAPSPRAEPSHVTRPSPMHAATDMETQPVPAWPTTRSGRTVILPTRYRD
jgi:hypothetical protein